MDIYIPVRRFFHVPLSHDNVASSTLLPYDTHSRLFRLKIHTWDLSCCAVFHSPVPMLHTPTFESTNTSIVYNVFLSLSTLVFYSSPYEFGIQRNIVYVHL